MAAGRVRRVVMRISPLETVTLLGL